MTTTARTNSRRLADKQQASADEILDAAAKAFGRRGYSATSIDDVADELGCTKGRVYHYYRTKGALFIGIHRRALTWALEAVEPAARATELPPTERLRQMVHGHVRHMMEHVDYMGPAQYHVEINLASEGRAKDSEVNEIFEMRHRFEQLFTDVIAAGITSGEFRAADPSLLTKAVLGVGNWMSVWFQPGRRGDTQKSREEIANTMCDFVVGGLRGN